MFPDIVLFDYKTRGESIRYDQSSCFSDDISLIAHIFLCGFITLLFIWPMQ